jgi:hypothetical protein
VLGITEIKVLAVSTAIWKFLLFIMIEMQYQKAQAILNKKYETMNNTKGG